MSSTARRVPHLPRCETELEWSDGHRVRGRSDLAACAAHERTDPRQQLPREDEGYDTEDFAHDCRAIGDDDIAQRAAKRLSAAC